MKKESLKNEGHKEAAEKKLKLLVL